mmetsp:Transcript_26971/g.69252  ORF Transcript_26971/g.69252 Transcript_26971/m.69252 type:complete len:201 (+) Transcript_26971:199-801(+)
MTALRRSLDGQHLLDGRLHLLHQRDGLVHVGPLHHHLAHPGGHAVIHAHALAACLHDRPYVHHVRVLLPLAQVVGVLEDAALLGVEGVLGDAAQRLGRGGGTRGDADAAHQLLLHQVHAVHQQVDVPHGAAAHAAVDLDEARATGRELALHVEHAALEAERRDRLDAQGEQVPLLVQRLRDRACIRGSGYRRQQDNTKRS